MTPRGMGRVAGILTTLVLLIGAVAAPEPLIEATRRGDLAAVQRLLESGADPNVAQGDGQTALHLAADKGSLEIVRALLRARADVNPRSRIGAYTPLHLASERAHTSVVQALLEAGADAGAVTSVSGVTPLHLAAKALNGEGAVKALLEHGAPVNAVETSAGQTALMFAASAGRAASVRELLSHGADPAISTEVVDVLKRLVIDEEAEQRLRNAMAEVRQSAPQGTDRPLTAAEEQKAIAAQREFLRSQDQIDALLKDFHPDQLAGRAPYWRTQNGVFKSPVEIVTRPQTETLVGRTGGMTALLHAAREGHIEVVEALLDGGADIDQVSADGSSPLVLALLNGQFDLAMRLIERGADPNLVTDTDGISPLFAVLQTQWSLRFDDYPQPRAHDNQPTQHMDVLNALLAAGADPNVPLKTHIWFLEWQGKIGMDFTGVTPFWRAAFALDVDAMKALVAHGADPHVPNRWPEPGMRPGRLADGRNEEDSGLPMAPEGAPNMYPIHAAAGGGYLGLGAFQQNQVPNNFVNAVKYLVEEHGADVNLPDTWGYTPLHYAAVRGDNDLIEYLVSKGADVTALSRLGQSTADMARGGMGGFFLRTPYPATVELLQKLGAPLKCLNTHFRNQGNYCPSSGVPPFEGQVNGQEPSFE